jgi:hypothetical protein
MKRFIAVALLFSPVFCFARRADVITQEDVRRDGFAAIRGLGAFCVMTKTETRCFAMKDKGLQSPSFTVGNPDWVSSQDGAICLGFAGSARCTRALSCLPGRWVDSQDSAQAFDRQCQWNTVFNGKWSPDTFFFDRLGACYIDSKGVTCTGSDGNYRHPNAPGATQMAVGWGFVVTSEQKEVVCRAEKDTAFKGRVNPYSATDMMPILKLRLRDPRLMAAGWNHACVWAMEKLTCFGSNEKGQTNAPELRGVVELMADAHFTCARHAGGTSCWGDLPPSYQGADPFGLVVRGDRNLCVTKGQTVDCSAHELDFSFEAWEAFTAFLEEQFVRLPHYQFRFQQLEADLREVARAAYAPKRLLLNAVSDVLEKRAPISPQDSAFFLSFKNASARLLAMWALEPVVREIGNQNKALTEEYSATLEKVKKAMSVTDVARLDKYPVVHRVAQALIREGLRSAREAVGSSEADEKLGQLVGSLTEIELRLGNAPSDADVEAASAEVLAKVEVQRELLSQMLTQPRGRSFVEMALEVARFLK